jgi:ribosomal protein S27AE
MNETKRCPYCGEEIMAAAKKCKYCGEWLIKDAP